jgi:hypothetical protein
MQTYLPRRQAAEYLTKKGLPITWRTLQKWATTGGGPLYRLFGNKAVYVPADLDAWAEAKLSKPRHSTSESEDARDHAWSPKSDLAGTFSEPKGGAI